MCRRQLGLGALLASLDGGERLQEATGLLLSEEQYWLGTEWWVESSTEEMRMCLVWRRVHGEREMRTAGQYLIPPACPLEQKLVGHHLPCALVWCGTCLCKCRDRLLILVLGRFGAAGLDLCCECQTGLGQCRGLCQVEPAVVKQAPCQELVRNE